MVQQRSELREYREVIEDRNFSPPSILLLVGEEKFFKKDIARKILAQIPEQDRGPDSFTERDLRNAREITEVLEDLRTPSFLSAKRVIYCTLTSLLLRQMGREVEESLVRALREGLPFGNLILDCPAPERTNRFVKEAIKENAVILCKKLWDTPPPWRRGGDPADTELNRWVVFHANRLGLRMTLKQAGELVSLIGNDPSALDSELRKLSARHGPNADLKEEYLQALVPDRRRDSIFNAAEAALQGNALSACTSLKRLFQFGYEYSGQIVSDPSAIASLLLSAVVRKLKVLRRASALFWGKSTAIPVGFLRSRSASGS